MPVSEPASGAVQGGGQRPFPGACWRPAAVEEGYDGIAWGHNLVSVCFLQQMTEQVLGACINRPVGTMPTEIQPVFWDAVI